jgi:hypothetical protein
VGLSGAQVPLFRLGSQAGNGHFLPPTLRLASRISCMILPGTPVVGPLTPPSNELFKAAFASVGCPSIKQLLCLYSCKRRIWLLASVPIPKQILPRLIQRTRRAQGIRGWKPLESGQQTHFRQSSLDALAARFGVRLGRVHATWSICIARDNAAHLSRWR